MWYYLSRGVIMKKIDKQAILGLRIMQRRKQLGINQSELAEQIGLSEHQISNIETGRSYPRMKSFIRICEILEVNADYFISGAMKDEIDENIIDMISSLSQEEQKTVWKLLDAYIHRNDDSREIGRASCRERV